MIEGVYIFFECFFAVISFITFVVFFADLIEYGDFNIVTFMIAALFAIISLLVFYGNDIDSKMQTRYKSQLYDCTKYTIDTISYNKDGSPKEFKIIEIK